MPTLPDHHKHCSRGEYAIKEYQKVRLHGYGMFRAGGTGITHPRYHRVSRAEHADYTIYEQSIVVGRVKHAGDASVSYEHN